ncbi:hypothetical protein Sste5346_009915 [Sporothrix stenoceras]|uniref:Zn(2)-C6 fungal-type domain-containing protein n=1 Tax=Sporothrix stenoceras TaxID=5173 RepID=A0ABR3YI04_9PEZI
MFAPPKSPACKGCARAKRKCDKRQPVCSRCRERMLRCAYPPVKPSSYVQLGQLPPPQQTTEQSLVHSSNLFDGLYLDSICKLPLPALPALPALSSLDTPSTNDSLDSVDIDLIDPDSLSLSWPLKLSERLQLDSVRSLGAPAPWLPLPDTSLAEPPSPSDWFISPHTWEIDHRVRLHRPDVDTSFLHLQISGIRSWMRTWVNTGGCPFIHPDLGDLYGGTLPPSMQVAFMSISSYIHQTEATTPLILDAVDTQSKQLVAAETLHAGLLEQLGRVYSLVVYQMVGLFDGNIRARERADERRGTLSRWTGQLLGAARHMDGMSPMSSSVILSSSLPRRLPWHTWILAESIRRVWVVANVVETIYHTLHHGWSPLTGSLPCTARYGLWQARSTTEWDAACKKGDHHLLNLHGLEHLIADTDAADVDVLSRALMSSAHGRERVVQWERASSNQKLANTHDR